MSIFTALDLCEWAELCSVAQHRESRKRAFKVQLCFPTVPFIAVAQSILSEKQQMQVFCIHPQNNTYLLLHNAKSPLMHIPPPAIKQSLVG